MTTLFRIAAVSLGLSVALPDMAMADLSKAMQLEAQSIVTADTVAVAQTPAVSVVVFSLKELPGILENLPEEDRDRCEEGDDPAADVELACKTVFQRIIDEVKAFLAASYGMTQSIGQFDPTTIAYSRETTLFFLDLE